MPKVLAQTCATDGCTAVILGEEAAHFRPLPYRYWSDDLGSLELPYGEGLIEDLDAACRKAGWHWDGSGWMCPECRAVVEVELIARAIGG